MALTRPSNFRIFPSPQRTNDVSKATVEELLHTAAERKKPVGVARKEVQPCVLPMPEAPVARPTLVKWETYLVSLGCLSPKPSALALSYSSGY